MVAEQCVLQEGYTALTEASRQGKLGTVESLVAHKADVNAVDEVKSATQSNRR